MMNSRRQLEESIGELLGEPIAMPGHPLIIAYCIMSAYANYQEGRSNNENGHSHIMADGNIPGYGHGVSLAINVLERLVDGCPVEDAIKYADELWRIGKAGGHLHAVVPGSAQAKKLESLFLDKTKTWLHNNLRLTKLSGVFNRAKIIIEEQMNGAIRKAYKEFNLTINKEKVRCRIEAIQCMDVQNMAYFMPSEQPRIEVSQTSPYFKNTERKNQFFTFSDDKKDDFFRHIDYAGLLGAVTFFDKDVKKANANRLATDKQAIKKSKIHLQERIGKIGEVNYKLDGDQFVFVVTSDSETIKDIVGTEFFAGFRVTYNN